MINSWCKHIEFLTVKAAQRIYILKILRNKGVDCTELCGIADSLVVSVLRYALCVWGSKGLTGLARNKINRVINSLNTTCNNMMQIDFPKLLKETDNKMMDKISINSTNPLFSLLPPLRPSPTNKLRQRSHNFTLPAVKTERMRLSFPYRTLFNAY
jgi:hypothetical protein